MRLIDADAFKKILSEHEMEHDKRRSFDDYAWGASNAYEHASDLLDEMPTVERPHGEWKYESYGQYLSTYKCSNCGFHGDKQWICCPYCGTDMRKEGEAE